MKLLKRLFGGTYWDAFARLLDRRVHEWIEAVERAKKGHPRKTTRE